jgi:type IV secretory pathway VirB2 component (pilin)
MESLVNKRGAGRTLPLLAMLAFAALFAVEPAFAQGGLDKVNTFMDNVLSILRGVSITVVTIAIMWAGYKFLFKHADIAECAKILAGGLLIGGAAELARFLLS